MLVSIFRFNRISVMLQIVSEQKRKPVEKFIKVHKILMKFFFIGYMVVATGLYFNFGFISDLFVSLIFLFGAIFVLLGIILQEKILKLRAEAVLSVIKVLVNTIEARDIYTKGWQNYNP
ncbi:MAG: hypothetical protein JRD93_18070 [Deltaproteobacteria bacterium]|nr:hypothetical protein [Deltaproteobacteria bacterium]